MRLVDYECTNSLLLSAYRGTEMVLSTQSPVGT